MHRRFALIIAADLLSCSPTPLSSSNDGGGIDASVDAGVISYCSPEGTPLVSFPPAPHGYGLGSSVPESEFVTDVGTWSARQAFTPCASDTRVLVLRIAGAWCGTCKRDALHTNEWLSQRSDVTLVELVHRDEQNAPADVATVKRWKQMIDANVVVAAAPDFPVKDAMGFAGALPLYVVIDPKTMRVMGYATNPSPEILLYEIDCAIAAIKHKPYPTRPSPILVDGHFTRDQVELMKAMTAPGAPPPDETNAKADDPKAAALGEALFSDVDVSPAKVACATCHDAKRDFTDGLQTSATADKLGRVDRNAPSVRFASYSPWQFWDGRADSLWMQALGPPESSAEMASSRLYIAHLIAKKYAASYESVFGTLPALSEASRFPSSGKPGDASYDAMSQVDKDAVSRVYANFGKSIAAFERTLRPKTSRFDRYIGGDTSALTEDEKLGFAQFFSGGCVQCHYGPRLTDDSFHNLRFATGRVDAQADRGRIDAIAKLASSEFRASGSFSDAPSEAAVLPPAHESMLGAFKTPALRAVPATGPFGHGGTMASLADVVRTYGKGGLELDDLGAVGEREPWVTQFAAYHDEHLVSFLKTLSTDE